VYIRPHFERHQQKICLEFQPIISPSPKGGSQVKKTDEWKIYRTRFLVRAKQLTEPLAFTDMLGREHCGNEGDYLVESSDGTRRVAPKALFEDIYVAIDTIHNAKRTPDRPGATLTGKGSAELRRTASA